jgi:hypothetical protein
MFDSGILAEELINEVMGEADIAIPVAKQSLVRELNALERLLYSEIIKEQAEETVTISEAIGDLPDLPDFEL